MQKSKVNFSFSGFTTVSANVWWLGDGAKFVTTYFPLKINIIAKRERDVTTFFALLPNCC